MALGDLGLSGGQERCQPLLVYGSPEGALGVDVDHRLPAVVEDLRVACLPERQGLDGFNKARVGKSDHSEKDGPCLAAAGGQRNGDQQRAFIARPKGDGAAHARLPVFDERSQQVALGKDGTHGDSGDRIGAGQEPAGAIDKVDAAGESAVRIPA